jgi:hypothetical protein
VESPYPRPEQTRSKSWVVDIIAAILAMSIVTPVLIVLIVPKLGGLFTAQGNDRSVSVYSYVTLSVGGWVLLGVAIAGVLGFTFYLRTRGPAGPRLNVKRVVWLSIGLTFPIATWALCSVLQAVWSAGDVVK